LIDQDLSGLKVVIVNWCRPADTIECIQSLQFNRLPLKQILIIDNGSKDDSLFQITKAFPEIETQSLPENIGFAGGYNYGIEVALTSGASKIFILNNDTTVDQNAISLLFTAEWDICVPKIYFQDPPDMIWSAGARWRQFPPMVIMRGYEQQDSLRYSKSIELEYATACALMVKSNVFEKVGLFNREYQNYFEDYDFIYRVRLAGFRIGYIPEAKVWHKVSRSLGSESPQRFWYLGRNSVLFYRMNNRFPSRIYFYYLVWVSLRELVKLNFQQIRHFWKGVRDGMEWIKNGTSSM
jgi:GT2 family glycosyltransferase